MSNMVPSNETRLYRTCWLTVQALSVLTYFHSNHSLLHNYVSGRKEAVHVRCGQRFRPTPETWLLLAFTSVSISGVKCCAAATFRMSFKWACVSLERSFVLLMFITEHLFTKICRPKHAQNFCSEGCHFGVAWNKILIECVQTRQGKFGLQIWITPQVNYFKLPINGQIRGFFFEW